MQTNQQPTRLWLRFGLLIAAVLVSMRPAGAQVLYGSVVGIVQDDSGGAVPNTAVTLVNNATGRSRETITGEDGTYSFPDVPAGSYTLTLAAKGFRTSRTNNVE